MLTYISLYAHQTKAASALTAKLQNKTEVEKSPIRKVTSDIDL